MFDLSNEERMISEVLDTIEEGNMDVPSMEKIANSLKKVTRKINSKSDSKFLKLRLNMIEGIVRSHQEINTECNETEEYERLTYKTLQEAIVNLDEWLREVENELDEFRKKKVNFQSDVDNLLDEVTYIHKLSLTLVHELNVSLICSRNTKSIFDDLAEIRERVVRSLGILYQMKMKNNSESQNCSNLPPEVQSTSTERISLTVDLSVYSTKWKDNVNVISNILRKCSTMTEMIEKRKDKDDSSNLDNSMTILKKIDSRLDHLSISINCNFVLNYQNEFDILRDALSNVEALPLENEEGQHGQLNSVKEKLQKLQNLIEDSSTNSLNVSLQKEQFSKVFTEVKRSSIESFLVDIQRRYEYFSSFSSATEDNFLNTILSLNDTVSWKEFEDKNPTNEKFKQYLALVETYTHLTNIMAIYVSDDDIIAVSDHTNIDEDIEKIKTIMLELLTTISLLETFNESLPHEFFVDKERFDESKRLSALSLVYDALKKLVLMEETQERCLLLDDRVCTLIVSIEEKMSDVDTVTTTASSWNDDFIKKIQHQAYWLINICHFYLEQFHYLSLNANLERLVSVINSLHVEECNFMKNSYFCKETTREYWFSMLQGWQERVEFQLTGETSIDHPEPIADEWSKFHSCMHLVCEFNQIDSNIDLYGVEFEPVFMEYLVSYRSELDKSNKRFIDEMLESKEPVYKFLQYISHEIHHLTNQRSMDLKVIDNIEEFQRRTQTFLQVTEYIDSLLQKIDDSCYDKTIVVQEQFRNVRTTLHKCKKNLLLQHNQFGKVFEELKAQSESLDQVQSSINCVDVFINQEISTLLSDSILLMIKRAQETLSNAKENQNSVTEKLRAIGDDVAYQSRPILKSIETIDVRNDKIKEEINSVFKKLQRLKQVISLIVVEEEQTHLHKNTIRILLMKIDIFSSLKMDSITSAEMGKNYVENIDNLIQDTKNQCHIVNTIERMNAEIVNKHRSGDSLLVKSLFDNEVFFFKNSFEKIQKLIKLKEQIINRLEILEKIKKNYQISIEKMKKIKMSVYPEQIFNDTRVSRECESLRSEVDEFLIFIHENFKDLNTEQKDGFVRDLEQMEALLDVYDHFIDMKSKRQMTQREYSETIHERNSQYFIDVENFNKGLDECWAKYIISKDDKMLLEATQRLLVGIIHIKFQVIDDCGEMLIKKLQESEGFQLHQECLMIIEKSVDKYKGYMVQVLLLKYGLSYDLKGVYNEFCLQLSMNLKTITELDGDDSYYKNVYIAEASKVLLEIWTHLNDGCSHLALATEEYSMISKYKESFSEINVLINDVVDMNEKINAKITNFRFLNSSLTSLSGRLNTYVMVVESLSEDCSIHKHLVMKRQSHFYRELITHHKTQYQLCEKLCDSIMEEEIVGFEIDDEVQNQFNVLTKDMKELNTKHSSAVLDLDTSLSEWEIIIEGQSVTNDQLKHIYEYLREMTQLERNGSLNAQLYIERLDMTMKSLGDALSKHSLRKVKIGSSSDQRFIIQHISLAKCCLTVGEMVTNRQKDNFENILNQFFSLRKEYETVKLDTINSLDELHCLYFETGLSLVEKYEFLRKIFKVLTEIDKTSLVWHSGYSHIAPSFTPCYTDHLNSNWNNLQKWIKKCWQTFDGVSENYNEFESVSNLLNIRLNLVQEYMEIAERCHNLTTNVFTRNHMCNIYDLRCCLKITETLMEQFASVEKQLKELDELKWNLQLLMFGQNDYLEDQISSESRKISDLKEVLELINTSQSSIKQRLLKIIEVNDSRMSNLISSYSCYEGEMKKFDKCTSLTGEVDSYVFLSPSECKSTTNGGSNLILSKSSIDELMEQNIGELSSVYTKLISAVSDQENFLNERWNKEMERSSKCDSLYQSKIAKLPENLYTSTPSNIEPGNIQMHSWFPDMKDSDSQTFGDYSQICTSPQLLLLSKGNEDSTVSCPITNISGFTPSDGIDSDKISQLSPNIISSIDEDYLQITDCLKSENDYPVLISEDLSPSIELIQGIRKNKEPIEGEIPTSDLQNKQIPLINTDENNEGAMVNSTEGAVAGVPPDDVDDDLTDGITDNGTEPPIESDTVLNAINDYDCRKQHLVEEIYDNSENNELKLAHVIVNENMATDEQDSPQFSGTVDQGCVANNDTDVQKLKECLNYSCKKIEGILVEEQSEMSDDHNTGEFDRITGSKEIRNNESNRDMINREVLRSSEFADNESEIGSSTVSQSYLKEISQKPLISDNINQNEISIGDQGIKYESMAKVEHGDLNILRENNNKRKKEEVNKNTVEGDIRPVNRMNSFNVDHVGDLSQLDIKVIGCVDDFTKFNSDGTSSEDREDLLKPKKETDISSSNLGNKFESNGEREDVNEVKNCNLKSNENDEKMCSTNMGSALDYKENEGKEYAYRMLARKTEKAEEFISNTEKMTKNTQENYQATVQDHQKSKDRNHEEIVEAVSLPSILVNDTRDKNDKFLELEDIRLDDDDNYISNVEQPAKWQRNNDKDVSNSNLEKRKIEDDQSNLENCPEIMLNDEEHGTNPIRHIKPSISEDNQELKVDILKRNSFVKNKNVNKIEIESDNNNAKTYINDDITQQYIDYHKENEAIEEWEWENKFEAFDEDPDRLGYHNVYLNKKTQYERRPRRMDTLTSVTTNDTTYPCYDDWYWLKLFFISFLLALIIIVLLLTHVSLFYNYEVYYVHILRNINPFSIQRYAPV